jgi:mRNA interferase RelE/StbE
MGGRPRYTIEVTRRAARALRQLRNDRPLLLRLDKAIRSLASDSRPSECKKLVGKQFDNLYRIRVGEWRILYAIEDERLLILILDVLRRDQAYRPR